MSRFHWDNAGNDQNRAIGEWQVLATAHEGLARAQATAGDVEAARATRDEAVALAGQISDAEDRDVVLADIESLPLSDGA